MVLGFSFLFLNGGFLQNFVTNSLISRKKKKKTGVKFGENFVAFSHIFLAF
jgi:hypothetical protein